MPFFGSSITFKPESSPPLDFIMSPVLSSTPIGVPAGILASFKKLGPKLPFGTGVVIACSPIPKDDNGAPCPTLPSIPSGPPKAPAEVAWPNA